MTAWFMRKMPVPKEVVFCVLCHVRLAGWELREPARICEECKSEMRGTAA